MLCLKIHYRALPPAEYCQWVWHCSQSLGLGFSSGHMYQRRHHPLSATQALRLKWSLLMSHAANSIADKIYLSTRVSFYFNSKQVTSISPILQNLMPPLFVYSSLYRLLTGEGKVVHAKAVWVEYAWAAILYISQTEGKKAWRVGNIHCTPFFLPTNCLTLGNSPN